MTRKKATDPVETEVEETTPEIEEAEQQDPVEESEHDRLEREGLI